MPDRLLREACRIINLMLQIESHQAFWTLGGLTRGGAADVGQLLPAAQVFALQVAGDNPFSSHSRWCVNFLPAWQNDVKWREIGSGLWCAHCLRQPLLSTCCLDGPRPGAICRDNKLY